MDQLEPIKQLLFQTRIRKNETVNQAQMANEPVFFYDPKCAAAADYNQLIDEILKL
jgi:cellulose biosynthesis protein BcsQ